jgi:hypothetical protein
MTAVGIYGVKLGDVVKDPEGNSLRVEEIVTPKMMNDPWRVRLHFVDDESIGVEVDASDLKNWEKVPE